MIEGGRAEAEAGGGDGEVVGMARGWGWGLGRGCRLFTVLTENRIHDLTNLGFWKGDGELARARPSFHFFYPRKGRWRTPPTPPPPSATIPE